MFKLFAALLLGAGSAAHAADSCAIPPNLTPVPAGAQEEARVVPVTKLVLAYYWWPEQCQSHAGEGCAQHFGFKVHGLWPDGAGRSYPQFCKSPTPLDAATVRANWCMTPSVSLLQHEWAKHGTCHWADAATYFGSARAVADKIALPDPAALNSAGALRDAVVAANPAVPRGAIFIGTDNKQWLTELRICLTTRYEPTACEDGDIGAPDRVPIRARPR